MGPFIADNLLSGRFHRFGAEWVETSAVFWVLGKLSSLLCCFFFSVVLLAFASHPTGKGHFVYVAPSAWCSGPGYVSEIFCRRCGCLPGCQTQSLGMAQLFETVLNNPLWIFLPGNLFLFLLDFCCPHFHLVCTWLCRQVYDLPNKLELAFSSSKLPSSCIQSCSPVLLLKGLMRKFKFALFLTNIVFKIVSYVIIQYP